MKYNKGFAPIAILLIVLGVAVVGGIAYYTGKDGSKIGINNPVDYQPNTQNQDTIKTPTTNNNIVSNPQTVTKPVATKNIDSTNLFTLTLGETVSINNNISIKFNEIKLVSFCGDDVVSCPDAHILLVQDTKSGVMKEITFSGEYQNINIGNFSVKFEQRINSKTAKFQLSYPLNSDTLKNQEKLYSEVRVFDPQADSIITSPLKISGRANDSWFANGLISIRLVDNNGKEIVKTTASKQIGTLLNPFEANLNFNKPSSGNGWLIIGKDNNQTELKISIYFEKFDASKARL